MQHSPYTRQTYRSRSYSGSEYVKKVASAIAKEHKVTLKIESRMFGGVQTKADMARNEVTLDLNDLYTYGDDFVIGALLHEIGHIKHSPLPKTIPFNAKPTLSKKEKSDKDILMMLYNMLEDKRVNAKMAQSHAGAPYYFSAMYTELLDLLAGKLESDNLTAPKSKEEHQAQAGKMIAALYPDWKPTDFKRPTNEEEEKILNDRIREQNENAAKTRAIVADVAYKKDALMTILALAELNDSGIVHIVKRYAEIEQKAQELLPLMKSAADKDATNEDIERLTMQAFAILADYIPPPLPDVDGNMPDALVNKMRKLSGENPQTDRNETEETKKGRYKSIREQWQELKAYGLKPEMRETSRTTDQEIRDEPLFSRAVSDSATTIARLTRLLKAYMRENEHQRFTGNKRKGLLAKRSLARVARDNFRVYRKREERKGRKYVVSVLLDTSGSMWHDHPTRAGGNLSKDPTKSRITTGMRASAILTKTFRALGFTSSLTIYGRRAKRVLDFADRLVPDDIVKSLAKLTDEHYCSHSNETIEGLEETIPRLRKEAAKTGAHALLVVITDGGLTHTDVRQSKELLETEIKRGGFTPMLFYVGTHEKVLDDPRYERTIEGDATKLLTEAVALVRSSIMEN